MDNAGAANTKGVEVEGLLQFTDTFNMQYSLAWIDFEFEEFFEGFCHLGRLPDYKFIGSGGPESLRC